MMYRNRNQLAVRGQSIHHRLCCYRSGLAISKQNYSTPYFLSPTISSNYVTVITRSRSTTNIPIKANSSLLSQQQKRRQQQQQHNSQLHKISLQSDSVKLLISTNASTIQYYQQQRNIIHQPTSTKGQRWQQQEWITNAAAVSMGIALAATFFSVISPACNDDQSEVVIPGFTDSLLLSSLLPYKVRCERNSNNNNTNNTNNNNNNNNNTPSDYYDSFANSKVQMDENGLPNYGSSTDPFMASGGGIPFIYDGRDFSPDDDPKDGRMSMYVYLKPIEPPQMTTSQSETIDTDLITSSSVTDPNSDYNKSLRAFERISTTRFVGTANNQRKESNEKLTKTEASISTNDSHQHSQQQQQQQQAPSIDNAAGNQQQPSSSLPSVVFATSINRDNRHLTHLVPSLENPLLKGESQDDFITRTNYKNIMHPRKTNHTTTPMVMTEKTYFANHPRVESSWLVKKLVLLGGPTSEELCWDVAQLLGIHQPHKMDVGQFNDGETRVQIQESVRGKHVYVIQSTKSTDAVMELFLIISTLRRASARKITAVIPYYGYGRQDKRTKRETIAAADIALLLEVMGVDQVICMDLHNDAVRGFFAPTVPVEHLMPGPVAAAYFHEIFTRRAEKDGGKYPKVTVVAAHEGQVARATQFQSVLQNLSGQSSDDIDLAVLSKTRIQPGEQFYEPKLVGTVSGRTCIIVDDIVSTGTTLLSNVQLLKKQNADSIYAWATHGVFALNKDNQPSTKTGSSSSSSTGTKSTGNTETVPEQIQQLDGLEFLLISNSVMNDIQLPSKIRLLNVAPLVAEAIARTLQGKAIDRIFDVDCTKVNGDRYEKPDRYDND